MESIYKRNWKKKGRSKKEHPYRPGRPKSIHKNKTRAKILLYLCVEDKPINTERLQNYYNNKLGFKSEKKGSSALHEHLNNLKESNLIVLKKVGRGGEKEVWANENKIIEIMKFLDEVELLPDFIKTKFYERNEGVILGIIQRKFNLSDEDFDMKYRYMFGVEEDKWDDIINKEAKGVVRRSTAMPTLVSPSLLRFILKREDSNFENLKEFLMYGYKFDLEHIFQFITTCFIVNNVLFNKVKDYNQDKLESWLTVIFSNIAKNDKKLIESA